MGTTNNTCDPGRITKLSKNLDTPHYKELAAEDFPGIKLLFDGRRVTDPDNWRGTPRLVIGE